MIRTPAHKQTDPAKAAGQIKTLGDYIKQKTANDPKKPTFEEWWKLNTPYATGTEIKIFELCKAAWDASRANI